MAPEELVRWLEPFSYPAVFAFLVGSGLGAPVSEDLILLASGLLAKKVGASIWAMCLVCYAGLVVSDALLFRIGRGLGQRALASGRMARVLTPERTARVFRHFEEYGMATVFVARFVPGLRAPTFLLAGAGGVSVRRFLLADGAAAVFSAGVLPYLGFRFGSQALELVRSASTGLVVVLITGVVLFTLRGWSRKRRALVRAREAERVTQLG